MKLKTKFLCLIAVLLAVSLGANLVWTSANKHAQMENELREQARALASAYGFDLPDDLAEAEDILREAAEQGLMDEGAELGDEADVSRLAEEVEKAHDVAYYRDVDASKRFDPDAPLMQNELHEQGSFGWQDGRV